MQSIGKKNNMIDRSSGFSLIEVLIAIAILGIGVLGVASMQLASINGNHTAGKITANATSSMDRIERLIALPYNHPDWKGTADEAYAALPAEEKGWHRPGPGEDGLDNNRNGRIDEAGETGDMSIQWLVVDDYPFGKIKTIRINVAQGVGSKRKSVTIVTYKMDAI